MFDQLWHLNSAALEISLSSKLKRLYDAAFVPNNKLHPLGIPKINMHERQYPTIISCYVFNFVNTLVAITYIDRMGTKNQLLRSDNQFSSL